MADREFSPESLPDLLPVYYKRLFPYGPYYRWLSYGNVRSNYFEQREFSFTLPGDVYVRYQSFTSQNEMETEIRRRNPLKIDIGAVFSLRPKDHHMLPSFRPMEKELIFDIDMTDYDEVRSCCSGADICVKCWRFMSIACKILDAALRGRRGIHCWVCDESARSLDDEARAVVAEYLQLISGGANMRKKVVLRGDKLHTSVRRAKDMVEKQFVNMCVEEQNILGTSESMEKFFGLIPDEIMKQDVKKEFQRHSTSKQRWEAVVKHIRYLRSKGQLKRNQQFLLEEIMLQYAYPRLDINVSKGLNHLLKSPFCIHPKTGKVCVPFNPKAAEKFNPTTVPTISELIQEINEYDAKSKEIDSDDVKSRMKDYKKTSMLKSIVVFEEFVRNLESTWKGKRLDASGMYTEVAYSEKLYVYI
ncbi:DNA primase small subunit [Blattella germanica]|nr:DNA primase small subunit [Blattella germanica]